MGKGLSSPKFALVFLLAFVVLMAWANEATALEINYPRFPGVEAPQDFMPKIGVDPAYPWSSVLPLFVGYFYVLSLIVATALVIISIVLGGALYLMAGSNVGRLFDAKEQIIAGFMGLALLLGSYFLLNVLNPKLNVLRLPGISETALPTISTIPSPTLPNQIYWELPLGTLQESVLTKIKEVDGPARAVKEKTEELKSLVKKDPSCLILCSSGLVDLLNEKCNCNNLASECNDLSCGVPELSCTANSGAAAQKTDLCRDYNSQIIPKKNEVEAKINELKAARLIMLEKKIALAKASSQLWATSQLAQNCSSGGPLDRETFLQELKDSPQTETRKVWNDVDAGDNPLTFYCVIENDLVQSILDQWSVMMQRVLSGFNLGPGPCQGGACPEGSGYCSFDNLRLYFPTDGSARSASVICQRESGSNPAAVNYGCLNGSSLDYSVGLFQINLLAWCPNAFTYTVNPVSCTIIDQAKLDQCEANLLTPEGNIQKAVRISKNGIDWTPWAAASVCGIVGELPACLPTPTPTNPEALSWPLNSPRVGQPFCEYLAGGKHLGIDIYSSNTDVLAAADGTVTRASFLCANPYSHLGNYVTLSHNIQETPYTTDYFHLASISVSVGDSVNKGQKIGTMGNTCTGDVHLHFALKQGATYTNPCLFLPEGAGGIGCPTTPATCSGF